MLFLLLLTSAVLVQEACPAGTSMANTDQANETVYPSKPHPRGYVALRAPKPVVLTGKLDDPAWAAAPFSEAFVDIQGPALPAPRFETRMKMLWDDSCLYIGAVLEEPHPWASLTQHDSVIYKDNDFEVFLDPDGDNHIYYEIEVNAHGTLWDLLLVKPYRDGGPAIHNWETIAPSEPTIGDGPTGWQPLRRAVWVDGALNDGGRASRGWSVELALPWSMLRHGANRECPPRPGDQWRINFSRVQWRTRWDPEGRQYVKDPPDQAEDNWVWSPQWEIAMHKPELWGYVQFSPVAAAAEAAVAAVAAEAFVPDPAWLLKTFLMDVYYAQKAFHERHQEFTASLDRLGIAPPPESVALNPRLQTTEVSFVVGAELLLPDGKLMRYYVDHESRLTSKLIQPLPRPAA